MLRLSRLADYAVVVALRLPAGAGIQTSGSLAALTGIPEPTVAKVLKMLASAGIAASSRGARGGYRLARPLAGVSIAEVIGAIDGPIAVTACVEGATSNCDVRSVCALNGRWSVVNEAIRGALGAISLAELRAAPAAIPPTPPPVPATAAAAE